MSRKADAFKKDIVFRTIEWGFNKFSFTTEELFLNFNLNWKDKQNAKSLEGKWLWENIFTANQQDGGTQFVGQETIFKCLTPSSNICKDTAFCLTTESKFKYIDFLELEQARENAVSARNFAMISICIALAALIATVVMPLYINNILNERNPLNHNQLSQMPCHESMGSKQYYIRRTNRR